MPRFVYVFLFGILVLLSGKQVLAQFQPLRDSAFPILAWIGVPERETTAARFKELKASGININFSNYSSVEAVEKALDIALKAGIQLLPHCPELKSEPEKTVRRLMKHPALFGYHLIDEPGATAFPELAAWVKRIQSVDDRHPCYINLFPNYAVADQLFGKNHPHSAERDNYTAYVDTFLQTVPVPFLSFDHYPIVQKDSLRYLRPAWYQNLEIVAAAAQRHRLPFWGFALSVAHAPYPIPTIAELRLQMFSNLAYGAQGLQYFTYWTPGRNPNWNFHHAPIDTNGKRTEVYDRIKVVNREIQNLAPVFLQARLITVAHTGNPIPPGTQPLTRLPAPVHELNTGNGGAVVSVLKKANRSFLVIVNRDFQHSMPLTIVTDEKVQRMLKDGTSVPAAAYNRTIEVDPGDMVLYYWED